MSTTNSLTQYIHVILTNTNTYIRTHTRTHTCHKPFLILPTFLKHVKNDVNGFVKREVGVKSK